MPAPDGALVAALDVGSTSVRAALFGADGGAVGPAPLARAPVAWRAEPSGAMEADPYALLDACAAVLDAADAEARRRGRAVDAVAVAAFWHGWMGWDDDGTPVTPLFGWGDARAAGAAARLRDRVDADAAHARTGCFVHASYPAAKSLWLRETAGDTFRRARRWSGFGEWLLHALTGAWRASPSMASGTGLMALGPCAWDEELRDACGLRADALPPVSDAPARGLRPPWAARWPALAHAEWHPPLGDGACASAGSGAWGRNVGVTVGTSAAVRSLREDPAPTPPPGLWCYRLDARRTVTGRALSNGGIVAAWARETLRLPPDLEAEVGAMAPDAHGLTVVPDLLAERPPREGGPGATIAGLTAATTPAQVARALMEAAALRMADALEAVEAATGRAERIVAGGGALHASRAWARIVADALGRPLVLSPEREGTARGAALVVLERLHALPDAAAAVDPAEGEPLDPDPAAHDVYRAARDRRAHLERRLAPARGP